MTASFTSSAPELEEALDYRAHDGVVLRIVERERCPACSITVRIVTAPDSKGKPRQATFTRLHLRCLEGATMMTWAKGLGR